jgi:hypothetical protein
MCAESISSPIERQRRGINSSLGQRPRIKSGLAPSAEGAIRSLQTAAMMTLHDVNRAFSALDWEHPVT